MKAIVSIFGLASALVFASIVFAADSSVQPLTRADCDKAGMRWNEGANVCAEPTSTAAPTGSSTVFAADTSSQPLTRADCDKAGMRWNEGARPKLSLNPLLALRAPASSSPSTKPHKRCRSLSRGQRNMTGACQPVARDIRRLLGLTLPRL
jgi:hypothetical protein